MTNAEIIAYICKERIHNNNKHDNSRMLKFLSYIENPQENLKFIHIAGTNGKGSTTTMMANVIKNSGYKVGKFISPHVITFNERIQINNQYISDEELNEYINILSPFIDDMESKKDAPIAFEIITAIAFMHYDKNNCDLVCLEVGLGGRLDPTNVIENTLISIITPIDIDHTDYLGDTIEKISKEKCGIIKKDKITVSYPIQSKEALKVIRATCAKKNNKLYIPNIEFLEILKSNRSINYFSYKNSHYKLNLIGKFQIYNALTVIVASNVLVSLGYNISFSAITTGISDSSIPCRLEKICDSPYTILDGSHNISGAIALKDFLNEYRGKKNYAIISMTKNKNSDEFISEIEPFFSEIILVEYNNNYNKTEKAEELLKITRKYTPNCKKMNSIDEAYKYILDIENVDLVLITGSLYLASNFRNMLIKD